MRVRLGVVGVGLLLILGCGQSDGGESSQTRASDQTRNLTVYVVNYPLLYFAERIGGEHVDVVFPAPPDVDPAYWSPEPDIIAAYQKADLILLNGAGYAQWTGRASLPESRVVDTSRAFHDRLIPIEDAVTHAHGPSGEHAHEEYAFTVWLDPLLAIDQARVIAAAFIDARPEHTADFQSGLAALESDLMEIDAAFKTAFTTNIVRMPVMFSHPVYQYFARRYQVDGRSVHWEPDEVPTEEMWTEFLTKVQDHPSLWMIWEAPPLPEVAARLDGVSTQSLVVDPCGNRPAEGDYLSVMRENVAAIEGSYIRRGRPAR